jgi:hypothetical protein
MAHELEPGRKFRKEVAHLRNALARANPRERGRA